MLVFATLFVCGGVYTDADVQRWAELVNGTKAVVLVAGECDLNVRGAMVRRVPLGAPSHHTNAKYVYVNAKFHLWRLPFKRVVYYDLDVFLKPPVTTCANMCPEDQSFCAVRDPVATWPVKSKTYFNSGFLVLTPNKSVAEDLFAIRTENRRFPDQDILNEYFTGWWHKLPKECNWLNYLENHPSAKEDMAVHMVHHSGHQ